MEKQDYKVYGNIDSAKKSKNKPIEELSEIEKLKIENRILKAQSKQQQMEIDFLKKLDEIERRWHSQEHVTQQNIQQ